MQVQSCVYIYMCASISKHQHLQCQGRHWTDLYPVYLNISRWFPVESQYAGIALCSFVPGQASKNSSTLGLDLFDWRHWGTILFVSMVFCSHVIIAYMIYILCIPRPSADHNFSPIPKGQKKCPFLNASSEPVFFVRGCFGPLSKHPHNIILEENLNRFENFNSWRLLGAIAISNYNYSIQSTTFFGKFESKTHVPSSPITLPSFSPLPFGSVGSWRFRSRWQSGGERGTGKGHWSIKSRRKRRK